MAENPAAPQASTTDAVSAAAQGSASVAEPEVADLESAAAAAPSGPSAAREICVARRLTRAVRVQPYQRIADDPVFRPLWIYALDPTQPRLEGAVALVNVPFEPLKEGPKGALFEIVETSGLDDGGDEEDDPQLMPVREGELSGSNSEDEEDAEEEVKEDKGESGTINLDDPRHLINSGRQPSTSDWLFHQQNVYAVCSLVYATFRTALGRDLGWGFGARADARGRHRLRVRPHVPGSQNASYDKRSGELRFGYFKAGQDAEWGMPGETVYTCLSHDIIAHELTHALLDGLRAGFMFPTRSDVLAFHEAFADIIALFQHFSYREVVLAAIRKSRGNLLDAAPLTDLARQFGLMTNRKSALRTAFTVDPTTNKPRIYKRDDELHALGSVLVSAVFDAFNTVFKRKAAPYVRLATGGTGVLQMGELPADLQSILATQASKLASQFLSICIRAIDYCPPADLEFGEFLRAVITADRDLVPSDPWAYREAWIEAFRIRRIFPPGVSNLTEDALVWRAPAGNAERLKWLTFAALKFRGDPGRPAGPKEVSRQAKAIGYHVSDAQRWVEANKLEDFGLTAPKKDETDCPCVESIRSSRRVGPDGQILFDLVAEVTQRRLVPTGDGRGRFVSYGGSTIIIGPDGAIRYVIGRGWRKDERLNQQREFVTSRLGRDYWKEEQQEGLNLHRPTSKIFQLLHGDKLDA